MGINIRSITGLSLISILVFSVTSFVPSESQAGSLISDVPSINVSSSEIGYGPTPDNQVLGKSEVVKFPSTESFTTNTTRSKIMEEAIAESFESRNITVVSQNFSKPQTISDVFAVDNAKRPLSTADKHGNSTIAESQVKGTQFTPYKVTGIPPLVKAAEAETSVGSKGSTIFFTGNTYAARSTDGGKNWQYLDVNKDMQTCCDQDVLYDPQHKIFIWFRQGSVNEFDGTNKDRVGVSRDTISWQMYDIIPSELNADWRYTELDYPNLALGDENLYITTNMFGTDGALIIRISLDDLQNFRPARYSYYFGPDVFTFTPVQGASDKMYWATHNNNAQMRLFEWGEDLPWKGIKVYDRSVAPWSQVIMGVAKCGIQASLNDPRSAEWCSRSDSRIQTGAISRNLVSFFWDADALTRTERNATFPWPYINAATFDTQNNMRYVGRPYIWSPDNAWLFASAAVNENGQVGLLAYYGDINNPPGLAFGIIDNLAKSESRGMLSLIESTHYPEPRTVRGQLDYPWGDYVRLRAHETFGPLKAWEAAGFVLEGGGSEQFIQPYFIKIRTYDPSASSGNNDDIIDFMPPEFQ